MICDGTNNAEFCSKVDLKIHPGVSQSKYRFLSQTVVQDSKPRYDPVGRMTQDGALLILVLKNNDILAFSEATWPMVSQDSVSLKRGNFVGDMRPVEMSSLAPQSCIVASMIALCWREGASYELFSLRTGMTIFCAIACMLGVDQRLHPRIANSEFHNVTLWSTNKGSPYCSTYNRGMCCGTFL